MQSQRWNWVALVFILIGIIVSTYLVVHHYNLLFGMSESKSFCTYSSKVDCDAVNTSKYSSIFGIPVAMFQAFILFVSLLLILAMKAFAADEKPVIARFFLYLSTLNFGATLVMGTISTFALKTFCLMCGSLYLVALVLFVCALKLSDSKPFSFLVKDLAGFMKPAKDGGTRGFFTLFLIIPIGSAVVSSMYEKSILSSTDFAKLIERNIDDWKDSKSFDLSVQGGVKEGNPSASFKIVEFFDYECPHCKRASPSIHAFVNAHRDDVEITYLNYPLDKSCNPRGGAHEFACMMARSAMCAKEQNKFEEANDWIFSHQEILSSESPQRLCDELGLDKDRFKKCVDSPTTFESLKTELDLGNKVNLEGTPAIFVNGKILQGGFLIPVLEAAYKASKK